ncbi:MAG: hemerythrin family protein [Deltaproteobacteria bacterium]|nr:hemerythrin family protein [Deltaproteobacteria bacterium]
MGIEWDESYAVGVDIIDAQHKELFSQISGLIDAMKASRGKERVCEVIGFLESYIRFHFATETRLMDEHGYPAAAAHLEEHADFVRLFRALREELVLSGPSPTLAISLNNQICNWLIRHVLGTDRPLGAFLRTVRPK